MGLEIVPGPKIPKGYSQCNLGECEVVTGMQCKV